jgi:hypothetical protein
MVNHLEWGFAQKKAGAVGILTGEFLVDGDERKTVCDGEAQVLTFSDGGEELQGTSLDAVRQTGAAKSVDDRRRVDGARESFKAVRRRKRRT